MTVSCTKNDWISLAGCLGPWLVGLAGGAHYWQTPSLIAFELVVDFGITPESPKAHKIV